MSDWVEGRDGRHPAYTERLWPPWWLVLVAVAMAASLGIAYGYALGTVAGWVVAGVGVALAVTGLVVTAPELRVDERVFRAGRARLPLPYVGRVAALDEEASREARGPQFDARAHTLLRTLSADRLVLIEVTDERDPHPFWLVSTRHPDELARVLSHAGRESATRP